MKKESVKLAESAINMQKDMNDLTVDKINSTAPKCDDPAPQQESLEQIAKREGAIYIKPKKRLSPPLGSLDNCKNPEKIKKEHARAWEYVKGMYENYVVNGEPIEFSLCLYPGDPDYLWNIPCNVPVYVPRFVANHLEDCQKYHSFGYVEKPSMSWQKDDFTHAFTPTGTHYRGKFRSIGAFS